MAMEEVEDAKKRCLAVIGRIERLSAPTTITPSCRRTLLKLVHSELNFLSRFSSNPNPLSLNIGHLETVVHVLQQPFISGVSRVCKPIPLSPSDRSTNDKSHLSRKGVYVDIVCTLFTNPVWILVSDRNPKYVSWNGCHRNKGVKQRIEQVLAAAQSSRMLKPSSIVIFFSNGLDNFVFSKLRDEFGASKINLEFSVFDFDVSEDLEGDWIHVIARSFRDACVLEIKLDFARNAVSCSGSGVKSSLVDASETQLEELQEEFTRVNLGEDFVNLISKLKFCTKDIKLVESSKPEDLVGDTHLINFDTTALIALISGISNGCVEKILATPEIELRRRFKGNYEFVIAQVMSEIEYPILAELGGMISEKRGLICESVLTEFKELVSMCAGTNEKLRAHQLIKSLMVVPDSPSERMMGLPTTRKLAFKNKLVFGTGDYWCAPTLTANMAFVRAVSQTGMSMSTIMHRPRALTGD